MKNQPEYHLSAAISQYLQLQHKDIIFKFTNDDSKLTIQQAVRAKKLNPYKGFTDLWIFEPTENHCGLFVELKASKDEIYKKNGEYRKNEHLESQIEMMEKLRKKGYKTAFCWDLIDFIAILKNYLIFGE